MFKSIKFFLAVTLVLAIWKLVSFLIAGWAIKRYAGEIRKNPLENEATNDSAKPADTEAEVAGVITEIKTIEKKKTLDCPNCEHTHDQAVCPGCGYSDPARD